MKLPVRAACCLVLVCLINPMHAQQDTFRLLYKVPGNTRFATADNLGQVYRITGLNAIEKYTPEGKLLFAYTSNRLGSAQSIDASNPLKTAVWYYDFRSVLLLNRSLTPLGELNLLQAGFPEVRCIASARDGNLWIYDEVVFRLRKITPEGMTLFESPNLGQIYPNQLNITWMEESDTRLFAMDTLLGLLVFDAFAQPQQQFKPMEIPEYFDILSNRLCYTNDSTWRVEDPFSGQLFEMPLPHSAMKQGQWKYFEGRLIRYGEDGMEVYASESKP